MDASDIKQVAEKCEQICEFIREQDSWGGAEISTARNHANPTQKSLCATTSRKVWPEFRKLLVAEYNKLAGSIAADKFFDPKSD